MNFCFVELKMRSTFETGYFAEFKLMIKIEAKGTYGWTLKQSSNRRCYMFSDGYESFAVQRLAS